ncbi:MAG: hypothetical protein HY675_01695 [Chloroflexi bacterium]|nr:hypothetical protein [Chloroflexota bacterium]
MKRRVFSVLFAMALAVGLGPPWTPVSIITAAPGITLDNTKWVEYPGNPVFDPATRAYYPSVMYDGGLYKMWYDATEGVAYATSSDGIVWNTVASTTGLKSARHSWVTRTDVGYEIWYWDQSQLYSINAIRHAQSSDGISWTNDAAITQDASQKLITGVSSWNRGSYGPSNVLFNPAITALDKTNIMNNRYVMYYDGTTGGDEFLGVAGSLDGKHWVGNPTGLPVLTHNPDAGGQQYVSRATVLKDGPVYRMWFSYGARTMDDGIGYAESADGISWAEDPNNPVFHKTDGVGWRAARTYTPSVLKVGSTYKMWFTGVDGGRNYAIGLATLRLVKDVAIDIKPGSDPNSINLKARGVVPVAVLTTSQFDATTVDPGTALFAGASPVRSSTEDVDGDGDMDLLLHFDIQNLNLTSSSASATLTADTHDGQPIEGTDTVNIVPKK